MRCSRPPVRSITPDIAVFPVVRRSLVLYGFVFGLTANLVGDSCDSAHAFGQAFFLIMHLKGSPKWASKRRCPSRLGSVCSHFRLQLVSFVASPCHALDDDHLNAEAYNEYDGYDDQAAAAAAADDDDEDEDGGGGDGDHVDDN